MMKMLLAVMQNLKYIVIFLSRCYVISLSLWRA